MPLPRFIGRAWPAVLRAGGGTSPFPRPLRSVPRRGADRLRVAWWHLRSTARGKWIRIASRPGNGTPRGSAPAFDLQGYNPIGWRPRASAGRPPPGVEAARAVPRRNPRRVHHLEDVQAFDAGAEARAGELARLAASGVAVRLEDGDRRLRPLLGDELFRLMTADVRGLDAAARELLGIRMQRAALREHSSWARTRRMGSAPFPTVSVLLVTRRPRFLQWALAGVARQTWPEVELVLALHGEGFGEVERRIAELPHPVKVLRAPAGEPLGAVLNAATAASGGTLLAKMDDDDVYGADHLWDLVLAREYSGAQLVGKWMEFVWLAASDRTIRWRNGSSERYRTTPPAGGTLLISRDDLDRAGGWRNLPGGVDGALAEDVLRARGRIYRTHGAGFMLVRHGCRHAWDNEEASDARFLARADDVWPGFRPDRAGVEALAMSHPALDRPPARDRRRPAPE